MWKTDYGIYCKDRGDVDDAKSQRGTGVTFMQVLKTYL